MKVLTHQNHLKYDIAALQQTEYTDCREFVNPPGADAPVSPRGVATSPTAL
jgi:hypothetical protein